MATTQGNAISDVAERVFSDVEKLIGQHFGRLADQAKTELSKAATAGVSFGGGAGLMARGDSSGRRRRGPHAAQGHGLATLALLRPLLGDGLCRRGWSVRDGGQGCFRDGTYPGRNGPLDSSGGRRLAPPSVHGEFHVRPARPPTPRPRTGGALSHSVPRPNRSIPVYAGRRVTQSVCPYCAVGCGLHVYTKGGKAHRHRGQPAARSTRGRSARRGRTRFQLAVNPHRVKHVLYRAPYSDHWETKPLDWAMDRIAELRQGGPRRGIHRQATRTGCWSTRSQHRHARRGDAGQRGELPHQEAVLRRAGGGVDREPGADLTLRLGARSGRLVRAGSGDELPAGPRQQRLHPVHGLQHGGGPPGRFPLADEGQGEGARS